ncbi:hypothetical protein D2T29_20425 [Sinirhodobacter populi]|uniref:Uncharacterized protein n=1 Tax=Paenirhodobacter populi TaxID=2306993 RepID=A0A443K148_9RHOB|nr:hypothetical protein [Sinirhodobacter populi]RWR26483.1 hypothetical protein D2T29_20425 [Sinirhodobacter populi]
MTTATNRADHLARHDLHAVLDYGLKRRLPPVGVIIGTAIAVAGVGVLAGGVGSLGAGNLLVLGGARLREVMVGATKRLMEGRALALTAVQAATVAVLLTWTGPGVFFVTAGVEFWGAVAFLVALLHQGGLLRPECCGETRQPDPCQLPDGDRASVRFCARMAGTADQPDDTGPVSEENGFGITELVRIDTLKDWPQSGFQLVAAWLRKGHAGPWTASRLGEGMRLTALPNPSSTP